jgi:energy-coupling factor transporter transmembrane protein EcfT
MAVCVAASLVFIVLSLTLASSDLGALLCFGIALVAALLLFAFGVAKKGRQRFASLLVVMVYVFAATLLMSNYSLVRDHVRWLFLSGDYKARVLAQPPGEELKHTEWDGWGFAGADTTVFLVSDPTDSLAVAAGSLPPVKARGLPCEVVRVRRLARQWYAVLFYTDTYWGQGACK